MSAERPPEGAGSESSPRPGAWLFRDLTSHRLIYLKGLMLVTLCVAASVLLIVQNPTPRTAFLVGVAVWASARSYYFAFYVIERYVDGRYRFSGLTSFVVFLVRGSPESPEG